MYSVLATGSGLFHFLGNDSPKKVNEYPREGKTEEPKSERSRESEKCRDDG